MVGNTPDRAKARRRGEHAALFVAAAATTACSGNVGPTSTPFASNTTSASASTPGIPTATAVASASAAPSAASPSTNSTPGPAWHFLGDDGSSAFGYKGPVEIKTPTGHCRFTYSDKEKGTSVECFGPKDASRVWGHDTTEAFVDDAALAVDERRLYVVRFCDISSGADVDAYEFESGALDWHTHLVALGPIAHSEYWAKAQAIAEAGVVRVFGSEAAGRYIEEVDATTGMTTGNWRVDDKGHTGPLEVVPDVRVPPLRHPGAAENVTFDFPPANGTPDLPTKDLVVRTPAGHCVLGFDRKADRTHFACFNAQSKRIWGLDLANQFVASGALAADDRNVYVASLSGIATGTTIAAFDAKTGIPQWRKSLFGVGPVDHSKYFNEVAMRMSGGNIVDLWLGGRREIRVESPRSEHGR